MNAAYIHDTKDQQCQLSANKKTLLTIQCLLLESFVKLKISRKSELKDCFLTKSHNWVKSPSWREASQPQSNRALAEEECLKLIGYNPQTSLTL